VLKYFFLYKDIDNKNPGKFRKMPDKSGKKQGIREMPGIPENPE
jgi:hypothetical protein